MSAIDGLFLESGSGGIAITAKFEKKMSFLQIECLGTDLPPEKYAIEKLVFLT